MKPKIKSKQLIAIINLIQDLKNFQRRGYGKISDIATFSHSAMPNAVFIRYQKEYFENSEYKYEYRIAEIDANGEVSFIDSKFSSIFERYAFLGEAKPFDIENPDDYEKVD